jgi:hypothetical protein
MARDPTGMELSSIKATAAIPPTRFSPRIRPLLSMATVFLHAGESAVLDMGDAGAGLRSDLSSDKDA